MTKQYQHRAAAAQMYAAIKARDPFQRDAALTQLMRAQYPYAGEVAYAATTPVSPAAPLLNPFLSAMPAPPRRQQKTLTDAELVAALRSAPWERQRGR